MLWLALHLPHLALDLFHSGRPVSEAPLVITEGPESRPRVHARNRAAARLGIRPGMPLAAAQALSGALRVYPRAPEQERAALEGLAAWAQQFTPLVSLEPPQGLLLEIGGSLNLFGGLEALVRRVEDGLASLGFHARTAAAPTPLGAWLLCLAGGGCHLTTPPALRARLARLPVELIAREPQTAEALRGLGLHNLGGLLRLPRAGLARRLGPRLLQDLDRAFGRLPDPRRPYTPPERFERSLSLPVPVENLEALRFPLRRLLMELTGLLAGRGAGLQALTLRLEHARGGATCMRLAHLQATRDPEHLEGLLRERLQRRPLAAPVQTLALEADGFVPLAPQAGELFTAADSDRLDWPRLAERLRARLGPEAVRGLRPAADHRPERAWAYGQAQAAPPITAPPRRPLWLLESPRRLALRHGAPWLDGPLRLLQGPERIESGWWDEAGIARDYYVAENPARERYWIFRTRGRPREWYLHGVFS